MTTNTEMRIVPPANAHPTVDPVSNLGWSEMYVIQGQRQQLYCRLLLYKIIIREMRSV